MKKLLSIGLCLMLLLAMAVNAVGVAAANPTVSLPDLTAKPGDTISVPIRFKNNPGLISAKVKVGYDTTALELLGTDLGDFPDSSYSTGDPKKSPYVVNFCNGLAKTNYTAELFATLRFRVKEDAKSGSYPLTLTCDFDGDFFNSNWDTVYFTLDEGSVTIKGAAGTQSTVQTNGTHKGTDSTSTAATSAGGKVTSAAQGGTVNGTNGTTQPTDGNSDAVTDSDTTLDAAVTAPTSTATKMEAGTTNAEETKKKTPLTPGLVAIPIAAVMIIAVTIQLVTILRRKKDGEE